MKRVDLSTKLENHSISGIIEQGCEFEGKLCFEGTVRIGGRFRGSIITNDVLVIGEGARVEGDVEAGTVIISGEMVGDIVAKHRVEIHRPAIFRGNIMTPSLMVDEGVIFEGSSRMISHRPAGEKSYLGRIESN
jgi:cytoskeletal protein CcmA (bactofilin family)